MKILIINFTMQITVSTFYCCLTMYMVTSSYVITLKIILMKLEQFKHLMIIVKPQKYVICKINLFFSLNYYIHWYALIKSYRQARVCMNVCTYYILCRIFIFTVGLYDFSLSYLKYFSILISSSKNRNISYTFDKNL